MESASTPVQPVAGQASIGDKGLKKGAIGFVSNVVIGVASTAPGYSLAAVLGFVAAAVAFQSPAILWVAFLPMLLIAASYYYMNRDDPDCGTSFTWVTSAMGPRMGFLSGWATLLACIIVMANLAQIAGLYTFLLFDWDSAAESTAAVTAVGVVWIAVMSLICYIGIELSARIQFFLLAAEVLTLAAFAVVALFKVYTTDVAGEVLPSLSWFNPFEIASASAFAAALILSIFIYWGWDSTVAVNEESEDSNRTPGRAAIMATIILVLIYVIVATAAQAYGGVDQLVENSDDVLSALGTEVFGSPWDKILIIAVLTSASASTQTTILPSTRSVLSMARAKAIPTYFGRVHPRFQTPDTATIWFGTISIIWYVGLTLVSENILFDSIAALGLMIALYYGLTGFAAAIYYRREMFASERTADSIGALVFGGLALVGAGFFLVDVASTQTNAWTAVLDHGSFVNAVSFAAAWLGVAALVVGLAAAVARTTNLRRLVLVGLSGTIGGTVLGWAFFKSAIDLWDPANSESGDSWFGIGPPFIIGIGGLLLGFVLMQLQNARSPEFFRRKIRVAPPGALDEPAPAPIAGGAPLPHEEQR
jgi:amino acid transporter